MHFFSSPEKKFALLIKKIYIMSCCVDTYIAATEGHLDCLKYLYENGCPWDEMTTYGAVIGGHLDCLKYAYENGCP